MLPVFVWSSDLENSMTGATAQGSLPGSQCSLADFLSVYGIFQGHFPPWWFNPFFSHRMKGFHHASELVFILNDVWLESCDFAHYMSDISR